MKAFLILLLALGAEPPAADDALVGPPAPAKLEEQAATLGTIAQEDVDEGQHELRAARLEALASPDAALPAHDELSRLLAVNTRDAAAIEARLAELAAEATSAGAAPRALEGTHTADGGVVAPRDGGAAPSGSEPPEGLDGGAPGGLDGGGASSGPGGGAPPAPDEDDPESRASLAHERAVLARALERAQAESRGADELSGLVEAQRFARERAEAEAKSAEAAQQQALEEARHSRSELLGKLFTRIAKAEGARAELLAARAFLHRESERDLEGVRQAAERAERLRTRAAQVEAGSAEADALFDDILEEERQSLAGVAIALERRARERPAAALVGALSREVIADRQAVTPLLETDPGGELKAALARLEEAVASLERLSSEVAEESASRWFTVADKRLGVARRLDQARLALLGKVSRDKADALRGFTEEASENLAVAARQLGLVVRLHGLRRLYDVEQLPSRFSGFIRAGNLLLAWGQALLLVLAAVWLWRKGPAWFERGKHAVVRRSRSAARARLWERTFSFLAFAGPRLFAMAIALAIEDVLQDAAPRPELDLLVEAVLWVASYQLASKLGHMLVLRLARRRLSLTVHHKLKILRSIRLLMRYGFLVAYVLSDTRALVGQGILYELVQRLAVLAALPVFVVLIQRWRADIVEAYLGGWPETRLARVVRAVEGHWYGFFVASAAFAFVAGKALVILGRDFVLGFDQTRRALAYLFRLRIERKARAQARPDVDVEALPVKVREAFEDSPATEPALVIDRFPGLEEAMKQLIDAPERFGPLLVHGPYGIGRTTWLTHLERRLAGARAVVWARPEQRILEPSSLLTWLGAALDVDAPTSCASLAAALREGEPRVVLLDGLEWLFLRRLGGYEALRTLHELTRATRGHIAWVMTAPEAAFRHLSQARRIDEQVAVTRRLGPWSEPDIRALIQSRQQASGFEVSFEDLLVHEMEGMREAAQVVETAEGYIRLLWNFAEGNPRIAQHFWLKSLIPAPSGRLKVNLYDAPSANHLEPLPETDRFVLAAFVLHRTLDIEEAAETCDLPFGVVEAHVLRGLQRGIYRELAPGSGRFVIDVHWWEAVLRFLRRKKLL